MAKRAAKTPKASQPETLPEAVALATGKATMRQSPRAAGKAYKVEWISVGKLKPYPGNPRVVPEEAVATVARSLEEFGWRSPIVVDAGMVVVAGHTRLMAAQSLGMTKVPVHVAHDLTPEQARAFRLMDNRAGELTSWQEELLAAELSELRSLGVDFEAAGFDLASAEELIGAHSGGASGGTTTSVSLRDRFGVPPFSVLDARQGYWQERKAAWLSLGIQSEIGRGGNLLKYSDTILQPDPKKRARKKLQERGADGDPSSTFGKTEKADRALAPGGGQTGTSIFDPVVCELAYRWFCPPAGQVLDPFAGGSVRGIVAAKLGRRYFGVDLRKEQCAANRAQARSIKCSPAPIWQEGDAQELTAIAAKAKLRSVDFLFTCPPYGDLEVYSDDKRDLSTMEHDEFLAAYNRAIYAAADLLAPDRFAGIVVGDFRDEDGLYRNFVGATVSAFIMAGLRLYNEAILVQAVGTASIRAAKQFVASRKLCKTHQNVLIFVKGDPRKATEAIGEVEFGNIDADSVAGDDPAAPGDADALLNGGEQ